MGVKSTPSRPGREGHSLMLQGDVVVCGVPEPSGNMEFNSMLASGGSGACHPSVGVALKYETRWKAKPGRERVRGEGRRP